ncbi:MAG TPA: hypothetical protein VK961_06990 [Chthoniobacter sp.]|nr:hypothetical protein [Chthoniobacter sp.]
MKNPIARVWNNKGVCAKVEIEVAGVDFIYGPTDVDIPGYDCFSMEHGFARAKQEDDNRRHPFYYLIEDKKDQWVLHRILETGQYGVRIGAIGAVIRKP